MLTTILSVLLPVLFTMLLGLLAGKLGDFDMNGATVLNRMVMRYALPLLLFSGLVQVPLAQMLRDSDLFFLIAFAMLGGYLFVFLVSWKLFHREMGTAALQALAICGPAVPFVGVPVLGNLFGSESMIPIAVGGILLNMIQVPITMILLSVAAAKRSKGEKADHGYLGYVAKAVKEPVVWAPFVALALVAAEISLPQVLVHSLNLLGNATSGAALFASGVILFTQRVSVSLPVIVSVLGRNIVVPVVILGLALLFKIPHPQDTESILAMAIPTASILVILSVQFDTAVRESASVLLLSTVLSMLTMGTFIALLT